MEPEDILRDEAEEVDDMDVDLDPEKKKDLIDDDTVSLEDEIDEELDLDKEDLMDDVNDN